MAIRLFSRHAARMAALALVIGPCSLAAQEPPPSPAAGPSETAPTMPAEAADTAAPALPPALAAGTLIEIRIDETVNSKTHKTGDWYALSLSQPIMLGERMLVPAGTVGRGQVVHSAKSSWGGKAGELILAARYLEFDGRQIPLRGMKLGGIGGNNEGLAFAASVAGGIVAMPLVFALNGKNADIPAGMLATAKLAEALPGSDPAASKASEPAPATDIQSPVAAPVAETSSTTETGEPEA